uniref:DUF1985 domain-containing protein n=1 Tax=Brassica oleracea var. oleracea TaxID=109376 RepID=A0A0D3DMY2_BRAOL
MSGELPKRLIKEGEETQVIHIYNNCRMLAFARRPLRFSLVEYHAVTGLQCNTSLSRKELVDFEDDGGFWSTVVRRKEGVTILDLWKNHHEVVKKWSNDDRIRLVYMCIIVTMVCARDEKANIPFKYINLVMDLENVRKYPWGFASFDLLCESIAKTRDKLKEKTTSYVLDGFSYALQIWAMEAVPKIGKLCGKKLDKGFMNGPRCVNWMGAAKISYGEFNRLENIFTFEDDIYPYISWSGNYEVVVNAAFRRADEVEEDRIKVLMKMIHTKHDFSDHVWEFEETPEFSWGLHDKQGEDDEVAKNDEEAPKNDEEDGSDEDFRTLKGSSNRVSRARKGKKRLPDRGMEKRKQKILSSRPTGTF